MTSPRKPILLLLAAGLAWMLHARAAADRQALRDALRRDLDAEVVNVAARVEHTMKSIYEGVRTISRLPGVRAVQRYGEDFGLDSRGAIQEIYNSLANNVSMSEVYLVPEDLEPDQLDPRTGRLQEPIMTFDQMILGKTADHGGEDSDEGPEVEEIEIYEYRLMREQLEWFRRNVARESLVRGLEVPSRSGPEVITCDNTRYSPSAPDDKDRSGLVLSVPFYRPEGALAGCVSAVVLTSVLSELLPDGRFALRLKEHDYTIPGPSEGTWRSSLAAVRAGAPDPALFYSAVREIPGPDTSARWLLWCGDSDAPLVASPAYRNTWVFELVAVVFTGVITLLLGLLLDSREQDMARAALLAAQKLDLEELSEAQRVRAAAVAQQVLELGKLTGSQSQTASQQSMALSQVASAVIELKTSMARVTEIVEDLHQKANVSLLAGEAGVQLTRSVRQQVGHLFDEMQAIRELSDQHARSVEEIHEFLAVVNEISEQSKLLALNAAIEAARAGEEGRGFAVVAGEVRKLASESQEATQRIRQILKRLMASLDGVRNGASRGIDEVGRTGDITRTAEEKIGELARTVADARVAGERVLAAVNQQAIGTETIAASMSELEETLARSVESIRQIDSVAREVGAAGKAEGPGGAPPPA